MAQMIGPGIAIAMLFTVNCFGQVTIWTENFDSYPDGTSAGQNFNLANPADDWFSGGCSACIDTADWWEVRSGVMEARDVNQVVFLQTELIDISGFTDVEFSLEVEESGDHEGPYFGLDACEDQQNEDYVNVLYRLDGGSWNLIGNYLNWCGLYGSCSSHTLYGDDGINSGDCRDHDDDWNSVTVSQKVIPGNTLELRIEAINSSTTEFIRFDNLSITGEMQLPVSLKSFEASVSGRNVILQWQTASEWNNDYFLIERTSADHYQWITIGSIPGAGNSNTILNYSFLDTQPLTKRSLYRLKQVDYDGSHNFSEIRSTYLPPVLTYFPNPATDYLKIPLNESGYYPISLRLFDITAREVYLPQTRTKTHILLNLKSLSQGQYILWYEQGGNSKQYRLAVIR